MSSPLIPRRAGHVLAALFSAVSLGCAALMTLDWFTPVPVGFFRLVLGASTGFVLAGLAAGALKTWRGRMLLLGLAGCWGGDMLGLRDFVAGALSFLLAHVAFIAVFAAPGLRPRRALAGTAAALVPAAVLLGIFLPGAPPGETPLVVAYVTVISLMVVSAFASRDAAPVFLAAAVLFYVSDIFVARWRYGDGAAMNGVFCYPLYYLSCNLFALGALTLRPRRENGRTPSRKDAQIFVRLP